MRNIMKATTIESKFPLLSVEHDCIVSKDAKSLLGCQLFLATAQSSGFDSARQHAANAGSGITDLNKSYVSLCLQF